MNIQKFVAYLNKLKGWHIEGAYYSDIIQWRDWWRGDYAPFHNVREMTLKGGDFKRIVIPSASISEMDDIVYNDSEPVGYDVTLVATADDTGSTHHEYIVKKEAA